MRTLNHCKAVVIVIGAAGLAGWANGQEANNSVMEKTGSPAGGDRPLYHAQELSIDGFASGSLSEQYLDHFSHHTLRHDARFGVGAGVNYFFTRYHECGVRHPAARQQRRHEPAGGDQPTAPAVH